MKTKSSAEYQNTPNGDQQCSVCSMYRKPNRCTLVEGRIAPEGWCKYFERA